jgi:hypothetical protein
MRVAINEGPVESMKDVETIGHATGCTIGWGTQRLHSNFLALALVPCPAPPFLQLVLCNRERTISS